jgi:protein-tyrosine phosphatase
MIDIHSHVLPGIDDGSKNITMSLEILKGLEEQGVTDLICTPHYIAETSQVSPRAKNEELLKKLQERAKKKGIKTNLYLGNEIYIDREIAKYLRTRRISPIANSKYLLVELPMSGEYTGYEDILKSLQESGWIIVLAHPERYHTFQKDYQIIKNLFQKYLFLKVFANSFLYFIFY